MSLTPKLGIDYISVNVLRPEATFLDDSWSKHTNQCKLFINAFRTQNPLSMITTLPEWAMESVNRSRSPVVLPCLYEYFAGCSCRGRSCPSTSSIAYMIPLRPQQSVWYSFSMGCGFLGKTCSQDRSTCWSTPTSSHPNSWSNTMDWTNIECVHWKLQSSHLPD